MIEDIQKQIERQAKENAVIVATDANFTAHPEAYSPRIFVRVVNTPTVIELLRDGTAIPWNRLPVGFFDYWLIDTVQGNTVLENVMMVRK